MRRESAGIAEGKYEILSVGQAGGMGEVYKVRHRLLGEIRAIKVMRARTALDPHRQERFLREARMVARLRHPNLAQLYDLAFHENGTAYMVLEWIEGADLAKLLNAAGPPPVSDALEVARQTLSCLEFLHGQGIVHRDVSADNLMVAAQPDGRIQVKLIDLGIAKEVDRGENLTREGLFVGKLRYAAPETIDSRKRPRAPDPRSDLYSFAVVLYELLTGVNPIGGSSEPELISGHLLRPPRPFAETDRHRRVPLAVQEVVLRALAKKPEERFQSAAELSAALARAGREAPLGLAPERTPISRSLARFEKDGPSPEDFPTLALSDGGIGEAPEILADPAADRSAARDGLASRSRELDQVLGRESRDWSAGEAAAASAEKEAWFEDLRREHGRRRSGQSSVVSSVIKVVRDHPRIMLSAALGVLLVIVLGFSGVLASSDETVPERPGMGVQGPAGAESGGVPVAAPVEAEPVSNPEPAGVEPVSPATGPPSLALTSDSAELTSLVLQRLDSSVQVVIRESLASAMTEDPSGGGPRVVLQLAARLGSTPVEAYDTVLSTCEVAASAQALAIPGARSLYSRTIRRSAPRCGEALALAGRQLADELAPALEALLAQGAP